MATKILRRVLVPGCSMVLAVPIITNKVYADCSDCDAPKRVKVNQLPLYGRPACKVEFEVEEEKQSSYEKSISSVRQVVWTYMDSIKDTTDVVYGKFEVGKAHSQDLLHYIQNDPGFLPRATVITVAGLGGIIAGYKGGVLRKAFFCSLSMTGAAALCYPNQAVDISQQGWDTVKGQAVDLWKASTTKSPVEEKTTPPPAQAEEKEAAPEVAPEPVKKAPSKDTILKTKEPTVQKTPAEPKTDLGQSNTEDKDLYTTRQ